MQPPGYACRTIVIFGTLKYGSLEINRLALNKLFQLQKRLPKWCQRFVKNGFKKPGLDHKILFKFH